MDGQPQPPPQPPEPSQVAPQPGPVERYRYQINGQLTAVDPREQTLRIKDLPNSFTVPLVVDDQTRITMNGEPVTLEQLPQCAQVRASYAMEGDQLVAKTITVTGNTGMGGSGEVQEPGGPVDQTPAPLPQPQQVDPMETMP